MSNNKTAKVESRVTSLTKAKAEVHAEQYYESSQADMIRTVIDEMYATVFGEIDPVAIQEARIDEDELRELIETGSAQDELASEHHVDDSSAGTVATDGGSVAQPTSYSTTLGPIELAKSGPELSWDEIRRSSMTTDGGRRRSKFTLTVSLQKSSNRIISTRLALWSRWAGTRPRTTS